MPIRHGNGFTSVRLAVVHGLPEASNAYQAWKLGDYIVSFVNLFRELPEASNAYQAWKPPLGHLDDDLVLRLPEASNAIRRMETLQSAHPEQRGA